MKKVKISDLKCRLDLQSSVRTQNGTTFAYETVWSTNKTVWGRIVVKSGLVFDRGDNTEPKVTHLITIRVSSGIGRSTRVKYGDRYFKIHRIDMQEDGNKVYLDLHCEEIDNEI